MGRIADSTKRLEPAIRRSPTDQGLGRSIWDRVFGTDKEERLRTPREEPPVPGGTFGRSTLSTDAAFKRLLEAFRSRAPGSWTDDRLSETNSYLGIAYVAIHRQNELLRQSEFQVWIKDHRVPGGKRPVTPDDPAQGNRLVKPYDLVTLLEKPNWEDNFGDVIANTNLQMDLTGSSLIWMVPNELGTPMELYNVATAMGVPQPVINPEYPNGYYRIQPLYPYGPFTSYPTPNSSVGAPIPAEWIIRIKYPHPLLRYEGYSPLTALNMPLDEVKAMDMSRWYKMKKSFNPNVVLNLKDMEGAQPLSDAEIDRIRAEFMNAFTGPQNDGNLFISTPGGELQEFGTSPREMDYQSSWDQLVSFCLGGLGITKPAAGMIEDSSYASLFATLKQLYWLNLGPKVERIGQKLTRMLAHFFGDNLIVEVRCKRIDDHEISFKKSELLISGKCGTKNELREMLDLPLTKEPWGEEIAGFEEPPEAAMEQPAPEPTPLEMLAQSQNPEYEPVELSSQRPETGTLNQGSRNPTKRLNKSFNGFTKHSWRT